MVTSPPTLMPEQVSKRILVVMGIPSLSEPVFKTPFIFTVGKANELILPGRGKRWQQEEQRENRDKCGRGRKWQYLERGGGVDGRKKESTKGVSGDGARGACTSYGRVE